MRPGALDVLRTVMLLLAVGAIVVGYTLSLWWILGGGLVALGLNLLSWRDYFRDGR